MDPTDSSLLPLVDKLIAELGLSWMTIWMRSGVRNFIWVQYCMRKKGSGKFIVDEECEPQEFHEDAFKVET